MVLKFTYTENTHPLKNELHTERTFLDILEGSLAAQGGERQGITVKEALCEHR